MRCYLQPAVVITVVSLEHRTGHPRLAAGLATPPSLPNRCHHLHRSRVDGCRRRRFDRSNSEIRRSKIPRVSELRKIPSGRLLEVGGVGLQGRVRRRVRVQPAVHLRHRCRPAARAAKRSAALEISRL